MGAAAIARAPTTSSPDYFNPAASALTILRGDPELLEQPWQQAASTLADRLEEAEE